MTEPAAVTVRLLQQLEQQDADRDAETPSRSTAKATTFAEADVPISPSVGQPAQRISPANMLEALVETDFDLNAAVVRLRRDA